MATKVVKLPDIGEGVAEAEIVEWHVAEGDEVQEDQMLAAVMTDKATVEIPSPVAGRVSGLAGEVGQVISVGSQLLTIETEGGASAAEAEAGDRIEEPVAPDMVAERGPAAGDNPEAGATEPATNEKEPEPHQAKEPPPAKAKPRTSAKPAAGLAGAHSGPPRPEGEKPIASPAVRGRALQGGIDLRQVRGSGPTGRITHEDIDAFLSGGVGVAVRAGGMRNEHVEEIKVAGLRKRIAERMADSTRRVAHFAYVDEVDVTALEELRAALNAEHVESRAKLTLLPFIVKALAVAIRDFPQMNAHYDDEANVVTRHGGLHAGIATQTKNGLMVPVLRHAEALDLWQTATEIRRLAEAARDGSAAREELSGSTITITSLGELGGIVTTPVINRPEVAIVGVNKIAVRPVWRDNQFVPRKIMNLSSSFDHRVVDGYDAAQFIQKIRKLLELPATLFMEA
jgi:2-oxoisovalerate dehydrogenase E2 component (dihydrolipoyl transacylase)